MVQSQTFLKCVGMQQSQVLILHRLLNLLDVLSAAVVVSAVVFSTVADSKERGFQLGIEGFCVHVSVFRMQTQRNRHFSCGTVCLPVAIRMANRLLTI